VSAAYRLALADALQLHDERVRIADVALRAARQAADDAEARLHLVRQARDDFKRAIRDAALAGQQQGGRDDG